MVDSSPPDLVPGQLYLRALTTVDKEELVFERHQLGGWVTVKCRQGRIVSKYSYAKHGFKMKDEK